MPNYRVATTSTKELADTCMLYLTLSSQNRYHSPLASWKELFFSNPNIKIDDCDIFQVHTATSFPGPNSLQNHFVVYQRQNGLPVLTVHELLDTPKDDADELIKYGF